MPEKENPVEQERNAIIVQFQQLFEGITFGNHESTIQILQQLWRELDYLNDGEPVMEIEAPDGRKYSRRDYLESDVSAIEISDIDQLITAIDDGHPALASVLWEKLERQRGKEIRFIVGTDEEILIRPKNLPRFLRD